MKRDQLDLKEESGERRLLTAIFCDLVDSTALASELGTDDLFELMDAYYQLCQEVVEDFGGSIYQFAGDGVVAVFGYADALDAFALRAVSAAVEISRKVQRIDQKLRSRLQTRIAVASGEAVIMPSRGSDGEQQMTITGSAVFLAARIQSAVDIGTVGISESTHGLVAEMVPLSGPRHVSLKGFGVDVPFWTVEGTDLSTALPALEQKRNDSAATGREREQGELRAKWKKVQAGEKQVVLVKGEPGIGKSFLINLFLEEVGHEAASVLLLRGSPIYAHSPLHPIRELLLHQIQTESDNKSGSTLARLNAVTGAALDSDERQAIEDLLAGVAKAPTKLGPKKRMVSILSSLFKLISARVKKGPVLVVADDIQWIDSATNDALLQIAEEDASAPLMVLLGCRDRDHQKLASWVAHEAVELAPLNPEVSMAIISSLDGKNCLDAMARSTLVERSEGMPLFLVELTKVMLNDHETNQADVTGDAVSRVPLTLHESLQARLDTVEAPTRHLLQVAAALGGPFGPNLLSQVLNLPLEQINSGLNSAVQAGLLHTLEENQDYVFEHSLIRDVAYGSQIRRAKTTLHARVASVLSMDDNTRPPTSPEVIAHHWTQAGMVHQAAPLWQKAASLALSRGAPKDAVTLYSKGLNLVADNAESDEVLRRLAFEMHLGLGQASYVARGPAEEKTVNAFRNALSLIDTIEDLDQRCQVIYGIFAGFHFSSQFDAAREPAQHMFQLATEKDQDRYLCQAHRMLAYINFFLANFPEMNQHIDQLAVHYERASALAMMIRFGSDCLIAASGFRAVSLALKGDHTATTNLLSNNLAAAHSLGHPATIGWSYTAEIYAHCFLGNFEKVLELAEVAIPYCETNDVTAWGAHSRYLRIWSESKLFGASSSTILEMKDTLHLATKGVALAAPLFRALLADTLRRTGRLSDATKEARTAYDFCKQSGQRVFQPAATQVLADCLEADQSDESVYRTEANLLCSELCLQIDFVAMNSD